MDKGIKGGNCNRTACQQPGAVWFHNDTQKYYCEKCAHMLNRVNAIEAMQIYGGPLLVKETD